MVSKRECDKNIISFLFFLLIAKTSSHTLKLNNHRLRLYLPRPIKDFSEIWPRKQRGGSENVLNGIALGKDYVLITGKRWDRIYKVVFDDWPTLFNNGNN
jgi:hypothetical protein